MGGAPQTGMEDATTLDLQNQSSSSLKPTRTHYKPLLIDTSTHSKCRMRQNLAKQIIAERCDQHPMASNQPTSNQIKSNSSVTSNSRPAGVADAAVFTLWPWAPSRGPGHGRGVTTA